MARPRKTVAPAKAAAVKAEKTAEVKDGSLTVDFLSF